jgi:hypothetical protein
VEVDFKEDNSSIREAGHGIKIYGDNKKTRLK